MSDEPFHVRCEGDLPLAADMAQAAGSVGLAHLLRALYRRRIFFAPLTPDTSAAAFRTWAKRTSGSTAVAMICDDDGSDRGVAGWPIAKRVVTWSRTILIHSAGAEIKHYETAIVAAELGGGRGLVIECSTNTLGGWLALVQDARHHPHTLCILPENGGHPVPLCRSGLQ